MRIVVDAMALLDLGTGIRKYLLDLLGGLAEEDQEDLFVLLVIIGLRQRVRFPEFLRENFTYRTIRVPGRAFFPLWKLGGFPTIEFFAGKTDIFFSPKFILPPLLAKTKAVITIHDLSGILFPHFYSREIQEFSKKISPSIRRADMVLAVSEATKRDIASVFPECILKVRVVYNAAGCAFSPDKTPQDNIIREKYRIEGTFILSVGTLQPRKNYVRLLEAFAMAKRRIPQRDLRLVIVGREGWLYEDIYRKADELGIRQDVTFLGCVPDEELPAVYRASTCFVFPSLYEGFGIPVLEAMASGIPVACSNTSSLPEVAGEAAILFDPLDVDAMAEAMVLLLEDERLRQDLILKGHKKAEMFSWRKTAREVINAFRDLV